MGQINLNNFKVITDKLNTFFVDNKFMVASEIPTTGDFKVGDIIINNGPTNVDEPMWICIEAGNPGTWTVFNSGGGSGGKLTTARNRVVLNGESKSEVSIGVSGFNKASDVLMVFINSRFMTEGVDYEINADSTKIVAIGEVWNEELASEFEIEMIVFKMMGEEGVVSSVNEIVKLKNTVIVNESINEVEIGIDGFNEGDDLTVYRNSVYMIEGIDYEVQGNKIVSLKGAWNAEGGSDYKFTFEVIKTVAKVNPDAVIGMEHLNEDVREAIEAAGNIDLSGYATKEELNNIDLSGKQDTIDNNLVTTDKTIVGAINELFQSANNGKQLIASAIGEPLNAEDTFSAMSDKLNDMKSDLKQVLTDEGVSVTEEDDMASLISKVDDEFSDKNNELVSKVTPAGTATAANVLSGQTFINSTGQLVTGTMANQGSKTVTPSASNQTLGAGYYNGITINGDADLVAANIVSGKNIFGVNGSATVGSLGGRQFKSGNVTVSGGATTVNISVGFTPSLIMGVHVDGGGFPLISVCSNYTTNFTCKINGSCINKQYTSSINGSNVVLALQWSSYTNGNNYTVTWYAFS